ncbi:MAG: arylsulfatase [Akkermansiaceae bacterium]|nr:arylsulfatase [Akkermansiaceae bacterium]
MNFRTLLPFLIALGLAGASPAKAPNIILIIADDMGYSDLGCYGGEIRTPHLDALAKGGVRFTNFYVNNMCWPTRASLMTSHYPKTALPRNGSADGGLRPGAITLPQILRDGGYRTYMAGKWHLSDPQRPDGPNAPHHRGFDRFYGTIHGAGSFYAPVSLVRDGQDASADFADDPGYYYTDAISDNALAFLREHRERAAEKPYFLYMAYTAAHWPLHARESDIAKYRGKYAMGWDKLREQRHARMKELGVVDPAWALSPRHPDVPAWEEAAHRDWQQRRMEVYAAQVTVMDEGIGRVVQHVRESGEFAETLILYMHDNGGCHVEYGPGRKGAYLPEKTRDGKPMIPGNLPEHMPGPEHTYQSYGYGWANASNTPFRLFKQHDHEGGTRSPLIVSWPERIKRGGATEGPTPGSLNARVCHVIDIMPTLVGAAGVEWPRPDGAGEKPLAMEGRTFLPVLTGSARPAAPLEAIFWAHAKGKAVRKGPWKLVREGRKPWELYNLDADGTELHDLAARHPDQVAALRKLHAAWEKRTDAGGRR